LLYLYSFITQLLKLMQIILVSDWCMTLIRGVPIEIQKSFSFRGAYTL
jgi:hypothetical protein